MSLILFALWIQQTDQVKAIEPIKRPSALATAASMPTGIARELSKHVTDGLPHSSHLPAIQETMPQMALSPGAVSPMIQNSELLDRDLEALEALCDHYQVNLNPSTNPLYYANQGNLYLQQGDVRRSISSYLVALTLNPQNLDLYFSLTDIYLLLENHQMALALLNRASQIHGALVSITLKEAEIFIRSGDLDSARQSLELVINGDARNQTALIYLGDIYSLSGDLTAALASYGQVENEYGPSIEVAPRIGTIWMQRQNYPMAVKYYRHWVEAAPGDPQAHYTLGLALSHWGRYDEARQVFGEAAAVYLSRGHMQGFEAARRAQQRLDLMTLN
jgi:tetratricopeptide (TPR) repeat protein